MISCTLRLPKTIDFTGFSRLTYRNFEIFEKIKNTFFRNFISYRKHLGQNYYKSTQICEKQDFVHFVVKADDMSHSRATAPLIMSKQKC